MANWLLNNLIKPYRKFPNAKKAAMNCIGRHYLLF